MYINDILYGQKGVIRFGSRLEDGDYDVFVRNIGDYKSYISDLESEHYNNVDTCIMWAVLQARYNGIDFEKQEIVIQDPDTEIVKVYKSYDSLLEDLWKTLTDVPINPETEDIDDDWFVFESGTNRESIWYWFDEQHSKGVGWIMENIED